MTTFNLNDFLPYQLSVAASRISKAFERRYAAEAGISVPEWRVLAHLSQSARVSVREIEARVDMEKSKVSRAASRLEKAGLATKVTNPEDRRLVSLSLTPEGQALMARLAGIALGFQHELTALLGAERPAFETGLKRLTELKY
ncbi:MarR family winged helix-turn-helix transcriptional regulator [Pseudogemmobacter faecipullorum]|uniref:Winged helix-turn-helix transcriptional regulator n=1 Tax=Pseudogemmobacter faecipullorum TaxID=2755041 RepID=A0ABS8CM38_9RHOB|nr:MarR family winged helix-turn-helix transcriptional regulator [Pseudogemmobacter faecipullorum]MCB5410396.1 winged helix-turn-helix transcriptional regulator [Pseudogemmobacter faecipullorum]